MSAVKPLEKSSAPKLLAELPCKSWGQDRLQAFAVDTNKRIDEIGRPLAQQYWLLGAVLILLKLELGWGMLGQFLAKNSITKARAARARAIHRTFKSPEDLGDLTVESAYEKRRRKQSTKEIKARRTKPPKQAKPRETSPWNTLPEFLTGVVKQADLCFNEVTSAPPPNARPLIDEITKAIERLTVLQQALKHKPVTLSTSDPVPT